MNCIREKLKGLEKRRLVMAIAVVAVIVYGVFLILCEIASRQAAQIFNKEMANQKVLAGSVTAEKLSADLWGNVYFTNLSWMAPDGNALVNVEQGRMKVSSWDIVRKRPSINSLKELELENAYIHVGFDDDMHADVLHKPSEEETEKSGQKADKKNLQLPEKIPNIKLILKDIVLSAEYKNRSFVLNDVNGSIEVEKHKDLILHLYAGKFGGSIVGDGFNIDGKVSLQQPQNVHLNLGLYKVVPSSLGLSNANDPMTITGEMKGLLTEPTIDGAVSMDELNMPGLNFSGIEGNYHYANGLISLDNVTGSIYGGSVEAYGLYHFDNRHYKIDAHGKDLLASIAARDNMINCKVELDIKFRYAGKEKGSMTYGSFKSGSGTYMLVPFKSISGKFSDQNKEMRFVDVIIETELGNIESDAFKIIDGKLHMDKLFFVDKDGDRIDLKKLGRDIKKAGQVN